MLTLNRIRGMINKDPALPNLSEEDKSDIISFLVLQRDEINQMIAITQRSKYNWLGELLEKVREEQSD